MVRNSSRSLGLQNDDDLAFRFPEPQRVDQRRIELVPNVIRQASLSHVEVAWFYPYDRSLWIKPEDHGATPHIGVHHPTERLERFLTKGE